MAPRLDMLPMPSLISLSSRTMLFKDIATCGQLLSLSRKEAPLLLHGKIRHCGRIYSKNGRRQLIK